MPQNAFYIESDGSRLQNSLSLTTRFGSIWTCRSGHPRAVGLRREMARVASGWIATLELFYWVADRK